MVVINTGNTIIDDIWLWRADHYADGQIKNHQNVNNVGLQVEGENVLAYGLAVEHSLNDLVVWNGNNGKVFFY